MRDAALAFLLVITLAASPAQASSFSDDSALGELFNFFRLLHRQIEETLAWIGQATDYSDPMREFLVPILDRAYSAQELTRRLDALAASLPRRVQAVLVDLASRLRRAPQPRPHTPRWVIEQVIHGSPQGETAQQAQVLDQVTEQNVAALATALGAAETARLAASQVVHDDGPRTSEYDGVSAARDLAVRAQYTPSTRAAMQLLVEAIATQIDQQAHASAAVIGRQTASIEQQTLLSLQLATVVDRLVALNDQENARQKDRFASRVAAGASLLESQRQTLSGIAQSLLRLNSARQQQEMDRFFSVLTGGVEGRADPVQP